jgi:hypothetical protein
LSNNGIGVENVSEWRNIAAPNLLEAGDIGTD